MTSCIMLPREVSTIPQLCHTQKRKSPFQKKWWSAKGFCPFQIKMMECQRFLSFPKKSDGAPRKMLALVPWAPAQQNKFCQARAQVPLCHDCVVLAFADVPSRLQLYRSSQKDRNYQIFRFDTCNTIPIQEYVPKLRGFKRELVNELNRIK